MLIIINPKKTPKTLIWPNPDVKRLDTWPQSCFLGKRSGWFNTRRYAKIPVWTLFPYFHLPPHNQAMFSQKWTATLKCSLKSAPTPKSHPVSFQTLEKHTFVFPKSVNCPNYVLLYISVYGYPIRKPSIVESGSSSLTEFMHILRVNFTFFPSNIAIKNFPKSRHITYKIPTHVGIRF